MLLRGDFKTEDISSFKLTLLRMKLLEYNITENEEEARVYEGGIQNRTSLKGAFRSLSNI